MAMEQSIEDFIPPSFDLKKYESLASSPTNDWLTNIVARLPAYYSVPADQILDVEKNDPIPSVYGETHHYAAMDTSVLKFSEAGEFLRIEFPSILSGDIEENIRCGADRLLDIDSSTFKHILALFCQNDKIESLCVFSIISLASQIKNNPALRKKFNDISGDNNLTPSIDAIIGNILLGPDEDDLTELENVPKTDVEQWHDVSKSSASLYTDHQLLDKNEMDFIQVDLSLPDHVLLEQFSEWLAKQRKSGKNTYNHKNKYLTKAKMRLWFDSRVIPYMDIVQWNAQYGRTVPHAVAGRIIFSDMSKNDFRNPAGIIADTTIKHMKEVTSRRTLIHLATQVISEIGRKP